MNLELQLEDLEDVVGLIYQLLNILTLMELHNLI